MTKQKVGRPIKFTDVYHKKWRTDQTNYNHELYIICREFDCTMKEARIIRRKRKLDQELKDKGLQDV